MVVNGATGNGSLFHPLTSFVKAEEKLALLPVDLLDLEAVRDRLWRKNFYW